MYMCACACALTIKYHYTHRDIFGGLISSPPYFPPCLPPPLFLFPPSPLPPPYLPPSLPPSLLLPTSSPPSFHLPLLTALLTSLPPSPPSLQSPSLPPPSPLPPTSFSNWYRHVTICSMATPSLSSRPRAALMWISAAVTNVLQVMTMANNLPSCVAALEISAMSTWPSHTRKESISDVSMYLEGVCVCACVHATCVRHAWMYMHACMQPRSCHYCHGYISHGAGERNQGYALLMTANKPETALYRAPTLSLLLASQSEFMWDF